MSKNPNAEIHTYKAEIHHQGKTQTIAITSDKTVLQSAHDAGIDLPTSCGAGVCTTCAAQILAGSVDQGDGMGISPQLQSEGYVLLCVAYPRSDLKLVSEKEEIVYQRQFGQPNS
jgi:ferredoxin